MMTIFLLPDALIIGKMKSSWPMPLIDDRVEIDELLDVVGPRLVVAGVDLARQDRSHFVARQVADDVLRPRVVRMKRDADLQRRFRLRGRRAADAEDGHRGEQREGPGSDTSHGRSSPDGWGVSENKEHAPSDGSITILRRSKDGGSGRLVIDCSITPTAEAGRLFSRTGIFARLVKLRLKPTGKTQASGRRRIFTRRPLRGRS